MHFQARLIANKTEKLYDFSGQFSYFAMISQNFSSFFHKLNFKNLPSGKPAFATKGP